MKLLRLAGRDLQQDIRSALIEASDPWPLPPLISEESSWQVLRPEAAAEQVAILAAFIAKSDGWLNCAPIRRVRTLPLLCYRDGLLLEAETAGFDDRPGLLTFIRTSAGLFVIDGTSPPMHAVNIAGDRIDLSEPENVVQYLKLFCSAVQGDQGPFRVVERVSDVLFASPPSAEVAYNLPMMLERLGEPQLTERGDAWKATASVTFGRGLYKAHFLVHKTGIVEMTDDKLIGQDLPLRQIRIHGLLRREDR